MITGCKSFHRCPSNFKAKKVIFASCFNGACTVAQINCIIDYYRNIPFSTTHHLNEQYF